MHGGTYVPHSTGSTATWFSRQVNEEPFFFSLPDSSAVSPKHSPCSEMDRFAGMATRVPFTGRASWGGLKACLYTFRGPAAKGVP